MTEFLVAEACIELVDAQEALDTLRAHEEGKPAVPPHVQKQIDEFRAFRS